MTKEAIKATHEEKAKLAKNGVFLTYSSGFWRAGMGWDGMALGSHVGSFHTNTILFPL